MRRVYLVDDEALALRRLARMLAATGRVDIVGQATDPEAALVEIETLAPELVFLDISMPVLDGFDVCARLPPYVMVVFTTAHDDYALRAFQTNAIDYLLKPIRDDELARALDKLTARTVALAPRRIVSRLGGRIQLVELAHVTHFHAEDKLTYAVTAERSYIVEPSIAELEAAHADFVRVHRATLVRLAAIVELRGATVRLRDGRELAVARERLKTVKDRLGIS